jgi:hypothetical protein
MLIEDSKKGLKFGLIMTGIRKSAYYIGTLFVPMFIGLGYSLIVILLSMDLWKSDVGPLAVLTITTSVTYVLFFWAISLLVSTPRLAHLFVTIFVGGGYVTNYVQASVLESLPTWAVLLTCINPRMGLSIYQYIATLSPKTGFQDEPSVYATPSINMIVYCSLAWMWFWVILGVVLDWMRISKDETRSISSFFKCGKVHPEEEIKVNPKIEQGPEMHEMGKVCIKGLGKIYKGASRRSLSDVSLEFSKGEIFGLLGISVVNG